MRNRIWIPVLGALVAVALAMPLRGDAQQQSSSRSDWPCGARLDPSYFQVSEGTGGNLLLLAPWEIGESAALLTAFSSHPATIHRLAGRLNPGVHEIQVPIDATVESAVFSVSVQCLQTSEINRPSGATLLPGEGVVDLSNFRAQRMMIVKQPEAGVWTVRASGSGVAAIVVQARSEVRLTGVEFAATGTTAFSPLPVPGKSNTIRINVSGPVTEVRASLVSAAAQQIAPLMLDEGGREGTYTAVVETLPSSFRVMIEGKTADGAAFQRVHAPLQSAVR